MLHLKTLDAAENFVARQQQLGNDVRWSNYDMVFFRPDPRGLTNPNGAIRNGVYGFENVSVPMRDGWHVDYRNVKKVKKNRRGTSH